ncbi:MAG: hypothetical protein LUF35_08915 [Lachnospiraceae bacterium]|nr:hypothetical protein [Lachnospiraceae bacterium]
MQRIRNIWNKCLLGLSLVLCAVLLTGTVADAATGSYSYDIWGNVVAAPDAYELERTVYASDLGLDGMASVSGVFYRNDKVYIIMNGRIIITDSEFENVTYITDYTREDGTESTISAPTGIYVTEDEHIYICEQAMGEIIEFDENYEYVRALGDPNCIGLTVTYRPKKLVVDSVGRIYVLIANCYEGFAELDPDGNFNRYVGATEVTYTAWELFWRSIATDEQLSRSELWLPTTYSDLAIDEDGFIFACVSGSDEEQPVKKLNSSGEDCLTVGEFEVSPMGDYESETSTSNLTQIAVADDGRFAVLDSNRSRIFVYSSDGYLMYELGGSGNGEGSLSSPVSICFMGDKILVADIVYQSIEVFTPTTYGALINAGLDAQSDYDYETAAEYWQQVLDINSNFYYANLGLGKYQMRIGEYEAAMENFKIGGDRSYYSSAFSKVSGEWMEANVGKILAVIVVLILLMVAWKIYRRFHPAVPSNSKAAVAGRKLKDTMFKWPGYMMSSPFKAFDDVKYYDDGSLAFSIIVIIVFGWISLIKYRYTGFLVSFVDIDNVNVPLIVGSAILPYVAFIFGNWAVGVLLSGKGKLVHVTKVVGYSLYPACWLYAIGTFLSNCVSEDEAALVSALFVLGMVLFFFYMFIGTIMVNQYSFTKNVASLILSAVALLLICFVLMLLATLIAQVANDILEIIKEVRLLF